MNQAEKAELLEQLEQWNKKDEYSRCIRAIEAIPEQERGYLLTVKGHPAYQWGRRASSSCGSLQLKSRPR